MTKNYSVLFDMEHVCVVHVYTHADARFQDIS